MAPERLRLPLLLSAAAGLLVWATAMRTSSEEDAPPPEAAAPTETTGALLVDLRDGADASDRLRVARLLVSAIAPAPWAAPSDAALGVPLSESARLYRLEPPASEVDDVLAALAHDPDVEGVELEGVYHLDPAEAVPVRLAAAVPGADDEDPAQAGPFVPDDPYYKHQWHLDLVGMPRAWRAGRGEGAVVAVIDTGVLYRDSGRFRQAPDLAATRFVPGHDFVDGDATPDDEHGHGTHVAGTIAQSTNNGLGVAGVAPAAAIMPVRVLDARGAGRLGSVAAGIRWAVDHGADVINLSLGGPFPSPSLARAIAHAHDEGVVVVAAAGNTGRGRVQHPAASRHAISVGAVRFDRELSFYSSFGKGLDLVAPGGDLRVDQNGDGLPDGVLQNTMLPRDPAHHDYIAYQGTSMAAPHVAGAAALLVAAGVHDPDAIERILESTADEKGEARRYGAGVLRVDRALEAATEGLPAGRGGLAVTLALLLLWPLRRRGQLAPAPLATLAVAVVVAGGVAWMPGLSGVGGAPAALGAAPGWLAPAVASAVVPFALVALLLSVRRLRFLVSGVALGFAAFLLTEALYPTNGLGFLPAGVAGAWLLANAAVACWLARASARR